MSFCRRLLGLATTVLVGSDGLITPPAYGARDLHPDARLAPARVAVPLLALSDNDQPMPPVAAVAPVLRAPSGQNKRTEQQRRRRRMWCKKYRDIVKNRVEFQTLPFVEELWGYGLSLAEIDTRFLSYKKTKKHYLYSAWRKHGHNIRTAELNRKKGDPDDQDYAGAIMNEPEVLALGLQLHRMRKAMIASGQRAQFREMLEIILTYRRRVITTYDESANREYRSRITRYHPEPSDMEGGCTDSKSMPLFTLDQYLSGGAPYVSIALDRKLYRRGKIRYGDEFRIPALDARHRAELERVGRRHIVFRAVDTGGGFTGKGFSRLDLCVTTKSYDSRYRNGGTTIGRVRLIQVKSTRTLGELISTSSGAGPRVATP